MKYKKPKFWDCPKTSFWSIILYPFSIIYLLLFNLVKILKIQEKFQIPIICIGNIYLGGTGKTPLVLEVFNIVKSSGKNPGIVKKSYDYLYDEITMLQKTGKIFLDKDRKKSINSLISSDYNVAILDDGFQDYSIDKSFSILCFNGNQLIGNGFLIPAGPLRENFNSIKRADCIIINGDKNYKFEDKVKKISKEIKIFYSKYKIANLNSFKNKKIIAFAGIGNPSNFFKLLKDNNIKLLKSFAFPDHHNYSDQELKKLQKISTENQAIIITTEKDYCRLNEDFKSNCEFVKVNLDIENKKDFINLIKSKI